MFLDFQIISNCCEILLGILCFLNCFLNNTFITLKKLLKDNININSSHIIIDKDVKRRSKADSQFNKTK